jgi:hypothetical protein
MEGMIVDEGVIVEIVRPAPVIRCLRARWARSW